MRLAAVRRRRAYTSPLVRRRPAKPLFIGSIPIAASNLPQQLTDIQKFSEKLTVVKNVVTLCIYFLRKPTNVSTIDNFAFVLIEYAHSLIACVRSSG